MDDVKIRKQNRPPTEAEREIICEVAEQVCGTRDTRERITNFLVRAINDTPRNRPSDILKSYLFIRAIKFRTTQLSPPQAAMRLSLDRHYKQSLERLQRFQREYYSENPKPQPPPPPPSIIQEPQKNKPPEYLNGQGSDKYIIPTPLSNNQRVGEEAHKRIKKDYQALAKKMDVEATDQEFDIMAWIYEGYRQREMSEFLLISQQATSKKIAKIRKKFKMSGCKKPKITPYIIGRGI